MIHPVPFSHSVFVNQEKQNPTSVRYSGIIQPEITFLIFKDATIIHQKQ